MRRALDLAKKGLGKTNPNPCVGAVIVKNGVIIGEGWHKRAGGDHAEIEALKNCQERGKNPKGAEMYVSLKPCCHFGKTGPCTDAIIKAGIRKVIAAIDDPNPLCKNTRAIFKKHGIEYQILNFPYVTLKIAMSLNGKITGQKGKYITGLESRKYVHKLRSEVDAILVGINTVIKDDPHLGVRHIQGKDPKRIILDSHLRIPFNSKVFRDKNVIIITSKQANQEKLKKLQKKADVLILPKNLKIILKELGKRNIMNILVEGGQKLNTEFLRQNCVDRILFFIAPMIIPEGKDCTLFFPKKSFKTENLRSFGHDFFVEILLKKTNKQKSKPQKQKESKS